MATAHFVKKARKKNPAVKKGESYYWWKFKFGPKHYSKTPPKPSQLTQSEFLSTVYGWSEQFDEIDEDTGLDDIRLTVESIIEEANQLADDQRDKKDNMPDALQDGEVGQLLESRADALEEFISELEAIDIDIDEDDKDEKNNLISEIQGCAYSGD